MGNADARRRGVGLALLLAAGSVGAADFNSSLAPLITLIAQANAAVAPTGVTRTIGSCHLIQNPSESGNAENASSPIREVNVYFFLKEKREVGLTGKVQLLEAPKHGALQPIPDHPEEWAFEYRPQADYEGPDRATFLVEIDGRKVRLVYFFKVMHGAPPGNESYDPYRDKKLCPKGLTGKSPPPSTPTATPRSPPSTTKVPQPTAVPLPFSLGSPPPSSTPSSPMPATSPSPSPTSPPPPSAVAAATASPSTPMPPATTGSSTPPLRTTPNSSPPPIPTSG